MAVTEHEADHRDPRHLAQHHPADASRRRAEREAQTDFSGALRDASAFWHNKIAGVPAAGRCRVHRHRGGAGKGAKRPAARGSYAFRSATKQYRTAPLKGLWQHPPYFHNGTAATVEDVVRRYNERLVLGLSDADVADLAEYLKSL